VTARSTGDTASRADHGAAARSGPPKVILLGPQRHDPIVASVLTSAGISGPVATITAGWQEREEDDRELHDHLGGRTVNLRLYARTEEIFARDRELRAAYRMRQEALRKVREIYALRLSYAMDAARELLRLKGDVTLLGPERLAAVEAVRLLDRRHLERASEIQDAFQARFRPRERAAVAEARREIAEILHGVSAVAIAGGQVAVLVNRLLLTGISDLIASKPIVAWSAGAMAISDRIILFHDDPPHGAGNAEAFLAGLGLAPGIVPLPHARKRLKLDDAARVSLFARRFAPAIAVVLEKGNRVDWDGRRWKPGIGTTGLREDGDVLEMSA
jgi:hypothetical protein